MFDGQTNLKCATRHCRCSFYGRGNLLNIQILFDIKNIINRWKYWRSFGKLKITNSFWNWLCKFVEIVHHERLSKLKWALVHWKGGKNCWFLLRIKEKYKLDLSTVVEWFFSVIELNKSRNIRKPSASAGVELTRLRSFYQPRILFSSH